MMMSSLVNWYTQAEGLWGLLIELSEELNRRFLF